jgi:ubiquinone/menaquinone biosynthesis C-methylase UbiE
MMIKQETVKTYDKIASTWNKKVWVQSQEFNQRIISFADISGDEVSLDVGIGTGNLENFLMTRTVMGIDISKRMLEECRKNHPGIKLYYADAERLPFDDESFDFVYSRNLLQNFKDPEKAFEEMYRVLKVGGKIMIIEGAVYEKERAYPTNIVRVVEPHHPLFPSHEQLRNLFFLLG